MRAGVTGDEEIMGLLRLQLAIAVFLFHIGLSSALGINILDGRAAVFCFFVVSGFYMEMVLTEKYNRERLGVGYAKMFYLSRFWRLYPTYFLVIVATIICTFFTPFVDLPKVLDFNQSAGWFETIRSLVTWIFNLTMLFLNLPSTSDLLIGPGWSLGIEVAFYVIAPFMLRLNRYFPLAPNF
ncbi:MAG: acyltransferase [Sideroxydans sp.]|nr:acyltransferase [Sideroxydans sp.]